MKINHNLLRVPAITELQQAEQALRANELRFKEVQRIAKMGSWEFDLASRELLWSEQVFFIFEIDQTLLDASYEVCLSRIHPEDRDAVNQAWTTY
ncbi:MAG: hypothetical protein H0U72_10055 [Nitrosospira sp.]|nr:hypothetical protein [Nitrosospira sp.]